MTSHDELELLRTAVQQANAPIARDLRTVKEHSEQIMARLSHLEARVNELEAHSTAHSGKIAGLTEIAHGAVKSAAHGQLTDSVHDAEIAAMHSELIGMNRKVDKVSADLNEHTQDEMRRDTKADKKTTLTQALIMILIPLSSLLTIYVQRQTMLQQPQTAPVLVPAK